MKLMQYDRIHRKYHLLWNSNQKAIIIKVHRDCLGSVTSIPNNSPWVNIMSEKHGIDGLFDSFSGDLSTDSFGFNHTIRRVRNLGNYVEFCVPIPQIKVETKFTCEDCGGTGKRLEEYACEGDKCLSCFRGSGKKHILDWRTAYIVTSSLSLFFEILDLNNETSAEEEQHVTISMIAEPGMHGSSLGGCFGVALSKYLRSNPLELENTILRNVTEAMQTAHGQMFTLDKYDSMTMRAEANDGSIGLSCPGDACGINTCFSSRGREEGREFSCHNVDSPLQSLTLLVGIASLVSQVDLYISAKRKVAPV